MVRDRVEPGTIYPAERFADHDRGLRIEWGGGLFVPGADQQRSPRNRCDGRKENLAASGDRHFADRTGKKMGK